jgi:DNA-binding NarL/FixJ family response regulator
VPLNEQEKRDYARLTPRQRQVTELIGDGFRRKAIAAKLAIAIGTVDFNLASIFRKLEVNSSVDVGLFELRRRQ